MDAKVEVAKSVVEWCITCESASRFRSLKEEFAKVRRAFEAVIAAASVSQPKPVDFRNGEPGVAECQCTRCKAERENTKGAAMVVDATTLERIRCATIANNGAATLRARGKDEAADALLSIVPVDQPCTPENPCPICVETNKRAEREKAKKLEVGGDVRNAWPIDANGSPVSEK